MENENVQSTGDKFKEYAARSKDGKLLKNFVIKTTESLLSVFFVFGFIAAIVVSTIVAEPLARFGFVAHMVVYLISFAGWSVVLVLTFYFIYLLIDIRDKLEIIANK